ncbi:uncharacterized protein [Montipora foliosa]|uniref:uncharacterized protein n=1 Tax=Montipora foliosa TaxID=591990 RepID=UPI0035F14BF2
MTREYISLLTMKQLFFILLCLSVTSLIFLYQNRDWGLESIRTLRLRYDLSAVDRGKTTNPEHLLINGAQDMTEAAAPYDKHWVFELEKKLRVLSFDDAPSNTKKVTFQGEHSTSINHTGSQCSYEGLHFESQLTSTNISCVLLKKTENDCNLAVKYFGNFNLSSDPLHCRNVPSRPICTFLTESRLAPTDRVSVKCWRDVCSKSSPIFLGCPDPEFGVMKNENSWLRFVNVGELEDELPTIVSRNSINGFNFCLLSCQEGSKGIKQALIFPPILKSKTKRTQQSNINVNIVLEDSVSRAHFYRSMPRSAQSLRDIVRDSTFHATVLDYEVVQSYAAFTLPNSHFLMAGKPLQDGSKSRRNGISVLAERFKRFGYQILMHEDLCWYDTWGSFLSPSYKKRARPFTEGFKRVFEKYKKVTKPHLDSVGLSYLSCEILQDLGVSNPFKSEKSENNLCWDGRTLSEYLLFYTKRFLLLTERNPEAAPALIYTHLNTGHESTGKRIRFDDSHLSRFLEEMARSKSTLTILLSDHGGKTSNYAIETLPGSLEVYSPMMFIIIPHKVALSLGKERMNALRLNQKRLVTAADLHRMLFSIAELTESATAVVETSGLFQPVPATRTCTDIKGLNSDAMCRCQGWRKFLSPKSLDVIWLAEFATGEINNMIQEQYLAGITRKVRDGGFGNCARYVGKAIERPRREHVGKHFITTLVLVVEPSYSGKIRERFEVQLRHSSFREHNVTLIKYTRLSFYSKYQNCVDKGVDVKLCSCGTPRERHRRSRVEDLIRTGHFVDYKLKSSTRSLQSACLLVTIHYLKKLAVSRKQIRLISIEVANVCKNVSISIRLGGIHRSTTFSHELPMALVMKPRTIRFLLAALNEWKYGLFKPIFMHAPVRPSKRVRKKRDRLNLT